MTDREQPTERAASTRRAVLLGAGALGAAGVLAACADDDDDVPSSPPTPADPATTSGGQPATPNPIKKADVPVGGGVVLKEANVVVTQPSSGTFTAFNATCPHAGCQVSGVSGGTINCACHGSQFAIADGAVVKGPATKGLTAKSVAVTGDSLTVS